LGGPRVAQASPKPNPKQAEGRKVEAPSFAAHAVAFLAKS